MHKINTKNKIQYVNKWRSCDGYNKNGIVAELEGFVHKNDSNKPWTILMCVYFERKCLWSWVVIVVKYYYK